MFIVPIQPMKPMEFSGSSSAVKPVAKENSFDNVLNNAITALEDSQKTSRQDAYQLAMGNIDNISEVTINTLKAESMIQTTVQVTSRIVSAYKEIMQIQV